MDNLDSMVDEITKNQKFQNSVDDILEEKKELDDKINEITKNQKFQNSVDDILEEQNIEDKVNQIVNGQDKQNNIDEMFEEIDLDNLPYTEEEQKYVDSYFYKMYQISLDNISNLKGYIVDNLSQQYVYNGYTFGSPFLQKIKYSYYLNIGFPVPERFIKNYLNTLSEQLNEGEINICENAYYKVDIAPLQYVKKENTSKVLREVNAYQVQVELKIKQKTHSK